MDLANKFRAYVALEKAKATTLMARFLERHADDQAFLRILWIRAELLEKCRRAREETVTPGLN